MAKNQGREFATMDDEERRRFALEPQARTQEIREELDLKEPQGDDPQGEPPRPRER